MQRVLQRAERASRTAARRATKKKDAKERGETWNRRQNRIRFNRTILDNERDARKNRNIDWDAGLLAPRRDIGDKANTFATAHIYAVQPPEIEPRDKPKWAHLVEGDRVVITRGRNKGKIGKITEYEADRGTCKLEGINQIEVHVPEWLRREQGITTELVTVTRGVPIADLKLVYALQDPVTGVFRDTVIDKLYRAGPEPTRFRKKGYRGERVIAGTNQIIPWPEEAPSQETEHKDDTPRMAVDEETFRPYLLAPPMPLSVIDELRNKYSKFRTRHDYDYITKKETEAAKEEDRKKLVNTMQTPLQELAALRAKEKQIPKLTDDQMARIGEVITQEKAKVMGAMQANP